MEGRLGVDQVSIHIGCFGKHGIEETCRIIGVFAILERDDYAVFHPQRFDDARNDWNLFHFRIMAFSRKIIGSPSDTGKPNSVSPGGCHCKPTGTCQFAEGERIRLRFHSDHNDRSDSA